MSDIKLYKDETSKLDRNWLIKVATDPKYGCVEVSPGTFRLPIARVAFAHLIEPKALKPKPGQKQEYEWSADFLFPPELDKSYFKPLLDAVHAAAVAKHGAEYVKNRKYFLPLKEQAEQLSSKGERWKGYNDEGYCLSARDKRDPPQISAVDGTPITDPLAVKSGVWGFALVSVFGFTQDGNSGVSCGLRGFIKVADDNSLGGASLDIGKAAEGLGGLEPPPSDISFDDDDGGLLD